MAKANRVCYCCGHEYYFCPSCPNDRKDPQIYTMWDSELCKDIFNTLVNESTKKITTKECKSKLIELGINNIDIKKESVKNHIDRVMSYKDITKIDIEENEVEAIEDSTIKEKVNEINIEIVKTKNKKKRNSIKNFDN